MKGRVFCSGLILCFLLLMLIYGLFSCSERGSPNPITPPQDTTHIDTTHHDTTDTTTHLPDSTGPGTLTLMSHTSIIENGNVIRIRGNTAFIGDGKKIKIVDFTEPNSPRLRSQYPSNGWNGYIMGLTINEQKAYITEGQYGYNFHIVDIANIDAPVELGQISLGGASANEIVVSDGYAYIANSNLGVAVIDITDPHYPSLVTRAQLSNATSLAISETNKILFVGSGIRGNGGWLVNISNPRLPNITTRFVTPGQSISLCYAFGYLFVADGTMGVSSFGSFQVFKVIAPNAVEFAFSDTLPMSAQSIATENNFAYIVCWDNSQNAYLVAYEIHSPERASRVYNIPISASKAVDVENKMIGIVGRSGLYIYRHSY